jgi:hypothetical protein
MGNLESKLRVEKMKVLRIMESLESDKILTDLPDWWTWRNEGGNSDDLASHKNKLIMLLPQEGKDGHALSGRNPRLFGRWWYTVTKTKKSSFMRARHSLKHGFCWKEGCYRGRERKQNLSYIIW